MDNAKQTFHIEDYDNMDDEMEGYEIVKIRDIVGKGFVVEKVIINKDKNCNETNPFAMKMAIDIDGDKLFFYTTSNRLVKTARNVIDYYGAFPPFKIKISTEKYGNSPNPGYKFETY